MHLEDLQRSFFKSFLRHSSIDRASADKMMIKARGPVWHKKQQTQGVIPPGLTGLDTQATWSYSRADGWVYGHGSFCLVSHQTTQATPVLGLFQWMPNSAHEAKRLAREMGEFAGVIRKVCMDSKADDQKLYYRLQQEHRIQLLTTPRDGMDKAPARQKMIRQMQTRANRKDYRQRSITVEPMQGLVKELFELNTCWMRGAPSNRWLFAAMGVAVQIAQHRAYRDKRSTWNIKKEVFGV